MQPIKQLRMDIDAIRILGGCAEGYPDAATCQKWAAALDGMMADVVTFRSALQSIEAGILDGETYEMFHGRAQQEARAALGR